MKLDFYEKALLALAVEACAYDFFLSWHELVNNWIARGDNGHGRIQVSGRTRIEVLTALLTDLGVTVPERPSAEAVRDCWDELTRNPGGLAPWTVLADFRDLHARDPLLAAAVLASGESRERSELEGVA